MMKKTRCLPAACFINGWAGLLSRRVRFPKEMTGIIINMPDGQAYTVFRHMHRVIRSDNNGSLLIIKFKFSKFGHRINRLLSWIPIPMIAGFKGFRDKVWMHDPQSGFWYGLYEWDDDEALKEYQESFVLRMMIKRADKKTLTLSKLSSRTLPEYLAFHTLVSQDSSLPLLTKAHCG